MAYLHPKTLPETSFHILHLLDDLEYVGKTNAIVKLSCADRNRYAVPASYKSLTSSRCNYRLPSFASAILACWPASDTALMNAFALAGVAAFPERMLRNIMCLP
jgi:hypothetical protein